MTHAIPQLPSRGLVSQRCPVTRELAPNRACAFDGFHISYNPRTADYGCATTALVLRGRVHFVLNGDHATDLIDAAEQHGIQGCIDIFIDRMHEANACSEHCMAAGVSADPFLLYPTTIDLIGQHNVDRIAAMARSHRE